MKPTPTTSHNRLTDSPENQLEGGFPSTDWHFRASAETCPASGAVPDLNRTSELRNFRDLSKEFLAAETSRDYRREAGFFAVLSIVSAWPIFLMIRELVRFLG